MVTACIDVIEQHGNFTIAGIIDLPSMKGETILGYPVIGDDSDIEQLAKDGTFLITIGQIKSPEKRIELFSKLQELRASLPTIISPQAYVSPHATIGDGTIVMHGATVNAAATIGHNCIINSHALIEHDAVIEDHCHISTGAIVNGGASIKTGGFIGSQTMIREGIEIGEYAVIGASTAILKTLPARSRIKQS